MARTALPGAPPASSRPSGMRSAERRFVAAVLIPVIIYMLVFSLFPIVWVVVLSLFDFSRHTQAAVRSGWAGAIPLSA